MINTPSSIPPVQTPEALAAVKRVTTRIAVTSVLAAAGNQHDQLQEISLSDYQAAVSAAPKRLLNPASWAGFLARFSKRPLPFGAMPGSSKSKIDCSQYVNGEYILAILPTDLNGVAWNERDIAAGEQFCFQPAGGNQLAQVASILPAAVRAAGTFQLQFLPGEDKATKVTAALQTAYGRIQALTLGSEGTAAA